MIESGTYLGEFWVPDNNIRYFGALRIDEDGSASLEIHQTQENYSNTHFEGYQTIWGIIADDYDVTLFNVAFRQSKGSSFVSFSVQYILSNSHIKSMDDALFNKCKAEFPYLRNWICSRRLCMGISNEKEALIVKRGTISNPTVNAILDDEIEIELHEGIRTKISYTSFHSEAYQYAHCILKTRNNKSINFYKQLITEFNQFLSIALYSRQYPNKVEFYDGTGEQSTFIFSIGKSKEPWQQLVAFDTLKDKVPMMLQNWHNQYQQIAPICRYLLLSFDNKSFDFPDFLIVAQALDGYHKRFLNKNDGRDRRKYKDGIDALLAHFSNVNAIKDAQIDSEVLEESRNKYSHLIPDDDDKITKAVSGQDLFYLTRKCKLLLTCCILEVSGLSIAEINECVQKSDVHYLADADDLTLAQSIKLQKGNVF